MATDKRDEVSFLQSNFLFSKLKEAQIQQLATQAEVKSFHRGEKIYLQGDAADYFFIVWAGKVRLIHTKGRRKPNVNQALFIYADFFGEECLFAPRYFDTAVAREQTLLLKFKKEDLTNLFNEIRGKPRGLFRKRKPSEIETVISATYHSRQTARKSRTKWVGENEAVYLVNRKHKIFLLSSLFWVFVLVFFGLFLSTYAVATGNLNALCQTLPLGMVFFGFLWGIWKFLDWRNDLYVITSQRVFWEEKTILLFESRQESPLDAIRSKKEISVPLLRLFFDYANITIETYTGQILMRRSERPGLFFKYIEILTYRAKDIANQVSDEAMAASIRRRLGLPEPPKEKDDVGQEEDEQFEEEKSIPAPATTTRTSLGEAWFYLTKFFYLRYQDGNQIIYRKHWFMLLKKIWLPSLFLFFVVLLGSFVAGFEGSYSTFELLCGWVIFIAVSLWWLYTLLDWHDDIYILTLDKVIDIDKKPFWFSDKKDASLDRILGIQHAQVGFVGVFLDFGTVSINVGGEKPLTFDYVRDPAEVHFEITERQNAYRRRKEEEAIAKERERVANWFAIYHRQVKQ